MSAGSITRSICGRFSGSSRALRGRREAGLFGVGGGNLLLDEGDLLLGFRDCGLQILQREFQLGRVQLLRFRSELRVPIVLNLPLQLRDQGLQFGDEDILLGHHRLLVLACRTLDRQLGLHRRKGLHHFGWEVRKPAEIKGLRHAAFYRFCWGKPSKNNAKSSASRHPAADGGSTFGVLMPSHSAPSNRASYWARDSRITPSRTLGQQNFEASRTL